MPPLTDRIELEDQRVEHVETRIEPNSGRNSPSVGMFLRVGDRERPSQEASFGTGFLSPHLWETVMHVGAAQCHENDTCAGRALQALFPQGNADLQAQVLLGPMGEFRQQLEAALRQRHEAGLLSPVTLVVPKEVFLELAVDLGHFRAEIEGPGSHIGSAAYEPFSMQLGGLLLTVDWLGSNRRQTAEEQRLVVVTRHRISGAEGIWVAHFEVNAQRVNGQHGGETQEEAVTSLLAVLPRVLRDEVL